MKKEILPSNLGASNVRQEYRSSVYADAHGSSCYDAWSTEDAMIATVDGAQEPDLSAERRDLKPFYKLSELSKLSGLTPRHIKAIFGRAGIEIESEGKGCSPIITLTQIRQALPSFWEASMHARDANDREELSRLAKIAKDSNR